EHRHADATHGEGTGLNESPRQSRRTRERDAACEAAKGAHGLAATAAAGSAATRTTAAAWAAAAWSAATRSTWIWVGRRVPTVRRVVWCPARRRPCATPPVRGRRQRVPAGWPVVPPARIRIGRQV